MGVPNGLVRLVVWAALAGGLMGAAALAQRSPAIGLPLAIAASALILWLLLRHGANF